MTATLKSFGSTAVAIFALAFVERLLPAIAAGLVVAAHEIHAESAAAQAQRQRGI